MTKLVVTLNLSFDFFVVLFITFFSLLRFFCTTGEKDYYEKQFETLKSFEEVDSIVASSFIDDEDLDEQSQDEKAMQISNYANVLLLALKVKTVTCSVELMIRE